MSETINTDVWFVVVNVFAASKKAASVWRKAEELMKQAEIPYRCVMTGESGNAMTLTMNACAEGYRRFVAVGGDGTVHDVLEGMMFHLEKAREAGTCVCLSDFTLAVLPVGSGNDWIKTAGIPHDIAGAVALFKSGHVARQDVVKASMLDPVSLPQEKVLKVSYMANIGGVGLDARVCERVNRNKKQGKRGKILYVTALLYNILHRIPSCARVFCDGEKVFDGYFLSMALGSGKYSGGGMRQTPDAVMDDGFLDLTVIPDLPILKIAKEAPKLFTGTFLTVKELVSARGRNLVIVPYDDALPCAAVSGVPVEVDGEVVGDAPVKFEVLEGQLNILRS